MICKVQNKNTIKVIKAEPIELEQLKIILSRRIKGWRFNPLVKKKIWDGRISKFKSGNSFAIGLWSFVQEQFKAEGLECQIKGIEKITKVKGNFKEFCEWSKKHMEKHPEIENPFDYQFETAWLFYKYKFASAELATGGGKTLVAWLFWRWINHKHKKLSKMLMIVPRASLVTQAESDFVDYNQNQLPLKIQEIYTEAKEIRGEPDIVIGTYQSLCKKPREWFKQFGLFVVDEAHSIKTKSVQDIIKNLDHTIWRIGFSGTLPDTKSLEYLNLLESTGPVINRVNVEELDQKDVISDYKIKCVFLDWLELEEREKIRDLFYAGTGEERAKNKMAAYNLELSWEKQSVKRLNLIASVISKSSKNSLILFKNHVTGKKLLELLKEKMTEWDIYYIDGNTDTKTRDWIKQQIKENDNVHLVASTKTFSEGLSVKNIHNIFQTQSYKVDTVARQSVGRGIRKLDGKFLNYIDFIDDFSISNESDWENYLLQHGKERISIYKKNGYKWETQRITI